MPIWLRKFTLFEMNSHYENKNAAAESAKEDTNGSKTLISSDGKVNTPAFAQESNAYKGKTSYK
jgi:hypothetical protein|tara:strand:- start:2322 stop:2513 length:192 start_codon:yes stop_codon:yes gene_type:complete